MKTIRFWTVGRKGAVKLSVPYGQSRTFELHEETPHGSVIREVNIIAFGFVDRLQWSCSRIEVGRGYVTEMQESYEAVVDRYFNRALPNWEKVIGRRVVRAVN